MKNVPGVFPGPYIELRIMTNVVLLTLFPMSDINDIEESAYILTLQVASQKSIILINERRSRR